MRFETIFDSMATPLPSRGAASRPYLVAGEDAHQVVFERKDETRRAGIALTARTTTQLIVDATRLVTLGAENVQAAQSDDFLVLFLDDPFSTGESLGPLLFRHLIGIDLLPS